MEVQELTPQRENSMPDSTISQEKTLSNLSLKEVDEGEGRMSMGFAMTPEFYSNTIGSTGSTKSKDSKLMGSSQEVLSGDTKAYLKKKRFVMLEKLLAKMNDPKKGVILKNRKKLFKTFYSCFSGDEFVDWCMLRCKFLLREEGLRLSQIFLIEGYIINLTNEEKPYDFTEVDFYCFQAPDYWPSSEIEPSDEEYLVHLFTYKHYSDMKADKFSDTYQERLEQLKRKFPTKWEEYQFMAKERAREFKLMEKSGTKYAMLREKSYWLLHRPMSAEVKAIKDDEEETHKIGCQSLDEWLMRFPVEQRLLMIEHRLEQYKSSLNLSRVKLSSSIKQLILRYEAYAKFDPFVSKGLKFNPFIDNPSSWVAEDPTEITPNDIKVWSLSFRDLINDPKGLRNLEKFLKTEFSTENIYFWQKCQELDKAENKAQFSALAKSIYQDFISLGSKNELNIDASIRNTITKKIEADEIDECIFADAKEAIFVLMSKDSYQRFMQSSLFAPKKAF